MLGFEFEKMRTIRAPVKIFPLKFFRLYISGSIVRPLCERVDVQ
jgi:hypothetical protein